MRVSFSAYRRRWPFKIALWFTPLLIISIVLAATSLHKAQTLADAVETTGTVVERFTREVPGRRRTRTEHVLVVAYHTADGTQMLTEYRPGIAEYEETPLGKAITLYYSPSRPQAVEYHPGRSASAARAAVTAGYIIGAIMLGLVFLTWITTGSMRRALRADKVYPATVTRHRRAFSWRRKYRMYFEDHRGIPGRTRPLPAAAIVPVGRPIPVLIDPESGRTWPVSDILA
ncbi:MAG: DUF3592 domain-containing protein [Paracoccaceae bacterium]